MKTRSTSKVQQCIIISKCFSFLQMLNYRIKPMQRKQVNKQKACAKASLKIPVRLGFRLLQEEQPSLSCEWKAKGISSKPF